MDRKQKIHKGQKKTTKVSSFDVRYFAKMIVILSLLSVILLVILSCCFYRHYCVLLLSLCW